MSYGFFAAGAAGNTIIDDANPVLRLAHKGEIKLSAVDTDPYAWRAAGFAYCVVTYPSPIRTATPPLVFGAPNSTVGSAGIGAFMPLGGPGAWTGFRAVIAVPGGGRLRVGAHAGWDYYACVYEAEARAAGSGYGLRLFNAADKVIFDSNWPIVPFRHLLTSWRKESSDSVIGFASDWGNESYNQAVNLDVVRQFYSHSWGAADGTLGVLLSSLSGLEIKGDAGLDDPRYVTIPPIIAFNGSGRSKIYCMIDAGIWQHPTIDPQAMSRFTLLTADISRL